MRQVYRLAYQKDDGEHTGFTWHTSITDAKKAERKSYVPCTMETFPLPTGKKALVTFLNIVAGHPDNG